MLVFASIVPHPPLLIPNIGKEEIAKVEKTKQALKQLEQDLYLAKPDIIITISPHGSLFSDAFSINAHTHFVLMFYRAYFSSLRSETLTLIQGPGQV